MTALLLAFVPLAGAGSTFAGKDFYFGDIHAHTGASGDGGSSDLGTCAVDATVTCDRDDCVENTDCGSYLDVVTTARENGLDFLAVVDHVTSARATTDAVSWQAVYDVVLAGNDEENGFVTIPGAEIFVEHDGGVDYGHKSLLLFGDDATLAGFTMSDAQPSGSTSNEVSACGDLTTFMDGLTAEFGDALLLPHHPGVDKPMPTDWACHDPTYAPAAEVYSEHGSSLDRHSDFDVSWNGYDVEYQCTVEEALDPAIWDIKLGFAAGSDNHDTHPGDVCRMDSVLVNHPYAAGLTAVVLDEGASFTRAAIYEAFQARRTYATTGPMLPVVVVYASGGETLGGMGEAWDWAAAADLDVTVRVPAELEAAVVGVTLQGPGVSWPATAAGDGAYTVTIPAADVPAYLFPDVSVSGAAWWPEGCQTGGDYDEEHVWVSPTWFAGGTTPVDVDEDGYAEAEDCDDNDPRINPGAVEGCHNSKDDDCDELVDELDPDCADTGEDTGDSGQDSGEDTDLPDSGDSDEPTDSPADTGTPPAPAGHRFCGAPLAPAAWLSLASLAMLRRRRR